MTNLEKAQEQITKEKEEKRIKMIKDCLIEKENFQIKIKEIDEKISLLENSDITLDIKPGVFCTGSNYSLTVD